MLHRTFWTERRLTGMTLILGCFLFLGAAGLIPRDTKGNFIVNLPLREQLLAIAAQTSLFQWSFSLFISGVIVTLLGLAMLTRLLRDAGDRTFSYLALIASLFGDVLMVIYIAFPLGVEPLAAQETVRTGVVPDSYACCLRRGCALHTRAAALGGLARSRLWLGWPGVSGFHRRECSSIPPLSDADCGGYPASPAKISASNPEPP